MNTYNKNVKNTYSKILAIIILCLISNPCLFSIENNLNNIELFKVDENEIEIPTNQLSIEFKVIQKVKPLLNFIFFELNSADIPKRYEMFEETDKIEFNINDLYYADNVATYYQVLNIIGERMQQNPSSKISVVGCSGNDEKDRKKLSDNRASAIKNYLTKVWKIQANRITTSSRLSPVNSSGANSNINDPFYVQRMEEDRRVEIYEQVSENSILAPIITYDTTSFSTPDYFRFKFNINNIDSIKYWQFNAGKLQYTRDRYFLGPDFNIPKSIDWFVDENQSALPKLSEPLSYFMKIVYNDGFVYNSERKSLAVNAKYNPVNYYIVENGKQASTFHLIFFDFNKSNLQKNDFKTIDYIKDKIKPNSTVYITGYTDNIGDLEYNQKLSLERAKVVSNILMNSTSNIILDNKVATNNSTPEQRFYNRTVIVRIETPLEGSE